MSVARHYGGMIMNNQHYLYLPLSDRLVSDSAMKKDKELSQEVKLERRIFSEIMKLDDEKFELAVNKYTKEFYENLNK